MASPDRPTAAPSLVSAEPDRLTIAWIAPPDGGSPITSYTVRHREAAGPGAWSTQTGVLITALTGYIVANLAHDTEYDIQFQAVNADGNSGYSPSLTQSTLEVTMANALRSLNKVQAGLEVTAGTLVAATRLIPHTAGILNPNIDWTDLAEVRGVRAKYDDVKTGQGSELKLTQHLDFENLLLPLLCGYASVVPTGAAPYIWTFTPARDAASALASATFEVVETDGASNIYEKAFGLARPHDHLDHRRGRGRVGGDHLDGPCGAGPRGARRWCPRGHARSSPRVYLRSTQTIPGRPSVPR